MVMDATLRPKAHAATGDGSTGGASPALYTSLSPLTAIREAQPLGRRMQPLTLCAYEVDVEPVFDSLDGDRKG